MTPIEARLIEPHSSAWNSAVDETGRNLHPTAAHTLFPAHFLKIVLPKLGGHMVLFHQDGATQGVGFLFPRGLSEDEAGDKRPVYTLRHHHFANAPPPDDRTAQAILDAVRPLLAGADLVYYNPTGPLHYHPTHRAIGNIDVGRPNAEEAALIPELQHRIWGSPRDAVYPGDLHSIEFAAGTSLIARVDGQPGGFLFGFNKFGGPPLPADWEERFNGGLRLESQAMGVLPDFRGMRIGNLLKRMQAEQAMQAGISIVNWTADPLQYPNAALNFGLLRALAFNFYPDYYPFRNALNRVPASRFGITWLVESDRVQNVPLTGARSLILDLPQHAEIERVNDGCEHVSYDADAAWIALEIPAAWTLMQQLDEAEAMRWRTVTDDLFSHYVGTKPGQYVITGAATDRERRFLIGQRVDDALWTHLGRVSRD